MRRAGLAPEVPDVPERLVEIPAQRPRTTVALPPVIMPSVAKMAGNFARAIVKYAASGLEQAAPDVREDRMATCRACPRFMADSARCSACGCWCSTKTAWLSERCPEGRW